MNTSYKNSVKYKIEYRLNRSRKKIFLRKDFADLGYSYRQISRAIKKLIKEKKLIKI